MAVEQTLNDRIDALLAIDFSPVKPDKNAVFTFPPRPPTKRELNRGYFNPVTKLHLRMHGRVAGLEAQFCIFNLEDVEVTKRLLHIYDAHIDMPLFLNKITEEDKVLFVLHCHDIMEYCPWRGGCHIALKEYTDGKYPDWFTDIWKSVYENSGK